MHRHTRHVHHLDRERYRGLVRVSFTICVHDRRPLLNDGCVVDALSHILLREARGTDCEILVYLFMPDHCHILLQGKSERSDTWAAITRFKQMAGYWLSKNFPGARWQRDFYDHILRAEEDTIRHVRYILENPLRKGLTRDWNSYLHKGSTVFVLQEIR